MRFSCNETLIIFVAVRDIGFSMVRLHTEEASGIASCYTQNSKIKEFYFCKPIHYHNGKSTHSKNSLAALSRSVKWNWIQTESTFRHSLHPLALTETEDNNPFAQFRCNFKASYPLWFGSYCKWILKVFSFFFRKRHYSRLSRCSQTECSELTVIYSSLVSGSPEYFYIS